MDILLAALVAAGVAVGVVLFVQRPRALAANGGTVGAPERTDAMPAPAAPVRRDELEQELLARRSELARLEERLRARESTLDLKETELGEKERSLADRQRNLDHGRDELKESKRDQIRELERVAGLSAGQAKQVMMRELEDELRHDSARLVRLV